MSTLYFNLNSQREIAYSFKLDERSQKLLKHMLTSKAISSIRYWMTSIFHKHIREDTMSFPDYVLVYKDDDEINFMSLCITSKEFDISFNDKDFIDWCDTMGEFNELSRELE